MSVRATRLLQMLDQLRGRRFPVRGAQLAEHLGVSLRTVYRDIETLRDQGADIEGDRGVGYRLKSGFTLPALTFPAEELEALVLGARWVASHGDPELALAAEQALDRVAGVLSEPLRLQVQTSGLFAPLWPARPQEPWVAVLRVAIRQGHAVRMRYRDAQGVVSDRVVWPFAMAFLDQMRLLAAWCEVRADFRHFRADRVVNVEDTGRPYPQQRHQLLHRWQLERSQRRQLARVGADS